MRLQCSVKECIPTGSNLICFVEGGRETVGLLFQTLGTPEPGPREPPCVKHHQVVGSALSWRSNWVTREPNYWAGFTASPPGCCISNRDLFHSQTTSCVRFPWVWGHSALALCAWSEGTMAAAWGFSLGWISGWFPSLPPAVPASSSKPISTPHARAPSPTPSQWKRPRSARSTAPYPDCDFCWRTQGVLREPHHHVSLEQRAPCTGFSPLMASFFSCHLGLPAASFQGRRQLERRRASTMNWAPPSLPKTSQAKVYFHSSRGLCPSVTYGQMVRVLNWLRSTTVLWLGSVPPRPGKWPLTWRLWSAESLNAMVLRMPARVLPRFRMIRTSFSSSWEGWPLSRQGVSFATFSKLGGLPCYSCSLSPHRSTLLREASEIFGYRWKRFFFLSYRRYSSFGTFILLNELLKTMKVTKCSCCRFWR